MIVDQTNAPNIKQNSINIQHTSSQRNNSDVNINKLYTYIKTKM